METKIFMDTKESRERMESGRIYQPNDEDIMKEQMQCLEGFFRDLPGGRVNQCAVDIEKDNLYRVHGNLLLYSKKQVEQVSAYE